jgi:serine/threonine protein kinase
MSKHVGPYCVTTVLGVGSYGKVKLAHHKDTREVVAIKILEKFTMSTKEKERLFREIDIMKQLIHPHIAHLIEVIDTKSKLYLVMEYVERTLHSYVKEKNGLSESEARRLFWQILGAIRFCHSLNIIHRDIKQQNLLLDKDNNIKLIDFGLSNFMENGKLRSTFCGTPAYAAPGKCLHTFST